jgi:hypothetical protein
MFDLEKTVHLKAILYKWKVALKWSFRLEKKQQPQQQVQILIPVPDSFSN